MDVLEEARRTEIEILRKMTPADRIAVMHGLILQAVALKEAWLREQEPGLEPDELRAKAWNLVTGGA